MDGMMKLRLAVTTLFILMAISIVSSFILVTTDENEFIEEYDKLSDNDQEVLENFYDKLTDHTALYSIIGLIQYAIAIGLFILMYKVWKLQGI